MRECRIVRLGDVCKQDRATIKTGERTDLRYIGLESIEPHTGQFNNGELSKTPEAPQANSFRFGTEHVLYGKLRPYLNKVALADFEGKCSTEIIPLRPAPELDRRYLSYFLRSPLTVSRISEKTSGARMPRADMDFVLGLEINLPSSAEQRRIVDILSRAEGIVRLRREAEKKAAEMPPALFLDMFGNPATNPKRWPTKQLKAVAAIGSGNGFPIANQGKTEGNYPFYKVSDMNLPGNEVEMGMANNYITEDDRRVLKATAFKPGTVIFPKIGAAVSTNKKRLLTVASCFDNNVMGISPSDEITPSFMHALMQGKNISDFASDSNPPSIRKTTVEEWMIPIPPIDLQLVFDSRIQSIRSIQAQQATATATAQAAFDTLLSQAFAKTKNMG